MALYLTRVVLMSDVLWSNIFELCYSDHSVTFGGVGRTAQVGHRRRCDGVDSIPQSLGICCGRLRHSGYIWVWSGFGRHGGLVVLSEHSVWLMVLLAAGVDRFVLTSFL